MSTSLTSKNRVNFDGRASPFKGMSFEPTKRSQRDRPTNRTFKSGSELLKEFQEGEISHRQFSDPREVQRVFSLRYQLNAQNALRQIDHVKKITHVLRKPDSPDEVANALVALLRDVDDRRYAWTKGGLTEPECIPTAPRRFIRWIAESSTSTNGDAILSGDDGRKTVVKALKILCGDITSQLVEVDEGGVKLTKEGGIAFSRFLTTHLLTKNFMPLEITVEAFIADALAGVSRLVSGEVEIIDAERPIIVEGATPIQKLVSTLSSLKILDTVRRLPEIVNGVEEAKSRGQPGESMAAVCFLLERLEDSGRSAFVELFKELVVNLDPPTVDYTVAKLSELFLRNSKKGVLSDTVELAILETVLLAAQNNLIQKPKPAVAILAEELEQITRSTGSKDMFRKVQATAFKVAEVLGLSVESTRAELCKVARSRFKSELASCGSPVVLVAGAGAVCRLADEQSLGDVLSVFALEKSLLRHDDRMAIADSVVDFIERIAAKDKVRANTYSDAAIKAMVPDSSGYNGADGDRIQRTRDHFLRIVPISLGGSLTKNTREEFARLTREAMKGRVYDVFGSDLSLELQTRARKKTLGVSALQEIVRSHIKAASEQRDVARLAGEN